MKKSLSATYFRFFLLIFFSLLVAYMFVAHRLEELVLQQVRSDLYETSRMIAPLVPPLESSLESGSDEADRFCKKIGAESELRVTLIALDGVVLGDSDADIGVMDLHHTRPEVRQALQDQVGFSRRLSSTVGLQFAYLAAPLYQADQLRGVLRLARPIQDVDSIFVAIRGRIVLLLTAILAAAAFFAYHIGGRIRKALRVLEEAARRILSGSYGGAVHIDFPDEAQGLAREMTLMSKELQRRIDEISTGKNELETILWSMLEAVILLDEELNIVRMNRAAARLLADEAETADTSKKRSLISVFRSSSLTDFAAFVQKRGETQESELSFNRAGETLYIQVHGTPIQLRGARGGTGSRRQPTEGSGTAAVLLVLNDITEIKRTEQMRKDFVSNVSHELKTPITSIIGFVETLQSGAVDDPEEARNFLQIIQRHGRRMDGIVDDLLSLSKLEHQSHGESLFQTVELAAPLNAALRVCRPKAEAKRIKIELHGDFNLRLNIIPRLIEQALVNIIDNAVKYSEEGTEIQISVKPQEGLAELAIRDQGMGIPAKELPRIFERFYRVDKARSRDLGGTGLGLAIVKHIIRVNRADIRVESRFGTGTTFFITFPLS
ncbi:MAG TPA: PAS domain-containing protein [Sediminispirochaeta sp.]|mgnify:CR=1 FL=1|nr:PAS domain-containing protein [Sediminispirochaeta sp.]